MSLATHQIAGEWLNRVNGALEGFLADNPLAWVDLGNTIKAKDIGTRLYMLENADREIVAIGVGKLFSPDAMNRVTFGLYYLEGRGARAHDLLKGLEDVLSGHRKSTGAWRGGYWLGGRHRKDGFTVTTGLMVERKFELAEKGKPTSGDPETNRRLMMYLRAQVARQRDKAYAVTEEEVDLNEQLKVAQAIGDEDAVEAVEANLEKIGRPIQRYQQYLLEFNRVKAYLEAIARSGRAEKSGDRRTQNAKSALPK